MVLQYLRKLSLVVAGQSGDGLELYNPSGDAQEGLHVKFTVRHRTVETASTLEARVYNVSSTTAHVIQKEFSQIELKAGYANQSGSTFGTLFRGTIVQARIGRENQTDTFIELIAASGDTALNWAVVNATLAKNHTPDDVRKAIASVFEQYNVKQGYSAELPATQMPRGVALWGMARDIARDHAFSNNLTWNIHNDQYETIPLHGVLPDEAIVLTPETGLVGMPQQTLDGVVGRCLLNPRIRHDCRIKLETPSIQEAALPTPLPAADAGQQIFKGRLGRPISQTDGIYRVLAADQVGDTRGNEWYSEFWCVALDGTLGLSDTAIKMDIGPYGQPSTSTPAGKSGFVPASDAVPAA